MRALFESQLRTAWKPLQVAPVVATEIRCYGYPDGGPTSPAIGSSPITNGAGTSPAGVAYPYSTALAMTLRTELAGRSHRGRMFIPLTGGAGFSTDGHVSLGAPVDAFVTAFCNFLRGVNAAASVGLVAVVSQKGAGSAELVTNVTCDNLPDTQRRRDAQLGVTARLGPINVEQP